MCWVIVDRNTNIKSSEFPRTDAVYTSHHGAKVALTRAINSGRVASGRYTLVPLTEYELNVPMVVRRNLMTGEEFMIRADQAGGPCDPSTERYWSM